MNPDRKTLSKVYWISGGAIVFLAVFAGVWQWLNATPQIDIPSPEMPEPNGYDFFIAAGKAYVQDVQGIDDSTDVSGRYEHIPRPRTPQQLKQMYPVEVKETWLRRNSPALKLLRQGLQHPAQHPPVSSSAYQYTYLSPFRNLVRTLAIESGAKAARNNWNGATDSALDGVEFGYNIQHGGALIVGHTGVALQHIGLKELQKVFPHLDAATSQKAVARLERLHSGRFTYAETLLAEKQATTASLLDLMQQRDWRQLFSLPICSLGSSHDTSSVAWTERVGVRFVAKKTVIENYTKSMDNFITHAKLPYKKRLPNLPYDDHAMNMLVPDFHERSCYWARTEARHSLVMTMIALHAFKLEKGRYPEKLTEIVPKYLKQVPTDPYGGGEPLRYRVENQKYTLWSIGPDGIDNQGQPIAKPQSNGTIHYLVQPDSKGDVVADVNFP